MAIYTSRRLSSIISKLTTIDSSLMLLFNVFNVKQDYITKEYELDINNINSLDYITKEYELDINNINSLDYITKEYELDINNIQSSYTQNTNSVVNISTAVPINSSRKRNFEELKVEIQKDRKYIKNDNSDENNVENN